MAFGVLEVTLVNSQGIRERNFLSCISCVGPWEVKKPFVCIQYGEQKCTSKVAHPGKGKKFIWNQNFEFNVDYEDEENTSYHKLVLHVMDKHKLSDDNYVGKATVYVKDVVSIGMEKGKVEVEVEGRKYRVVRPNKSYTGEISVALTFKRKDEEDKDFGGWKESQNSESY